MLLNKFHLGGGEEAKREVQLTYIHPKPEIKRKMGCTNLKRPRRSETNRLLSHLQSIINPVPAPLLALTLQCMQVQQSRVHTTRVTLHESPNALCGIVSKRAFRNISWDAHISHETLYMYMYIPSIDIKYVILVPCTYIVI